MEGSPILLPNGDTHPIRHHISCQMRGVIYIIFCQCGAFYVGKTIRPFWKRMKDHVYYATNGLLNTTINHHVAFRHKYHPQVFKFAALDHVYQNPRGGNFDQRVIQRETQWVYNGYITTYPGLNDMLSCKPFL